MGEPIKETFGTLVSIVKLLVPFLRQMAEVSDALGSGSISVSAKILVDLTTRRHRIRKATAPTSLRSEMSFRTSRI